MDKENIRYNSAKLEDDIYVIGIEYPGKEKGAYGGVFLKLVDFSTEQVKSWDVKYNFTDKKLVKKMFAKQYGHSIDLSGIYTKGSDQMTISYQAVVRDRDSYFGTRWMNNIVVLNINLETMDYKFSMIPSDVVSNLTLLHFSGAREFRRGNDYYRLTNREIVIVTMVDR